MKKIKLLAALTVVASIFFTSCGDVEPIDTAITDDTDIQTSILTTNEITNIEATSATAGGNITSDGGYAITARGIVWSTLQNPTIEDSKTTNGTGMGNFSSQLTNLAQNTVYYVRAYATNSEGTTYGNQLLFATLTDTSWPMVTTTAATNITSTTATTGGNVTYDGGHPITARGVVWSTSMNPTIANSKTVNGNGMGAFTSSMTGLSNNTTYYVRAYATNSSGTSYGNQIQIRTLASQVDNTPALMTANINGVQYNNMKPYLYSFTGNDVIVENDGAPAGDTRYLKIQGDTSDNIGTSYEINLHIPNDKWVPGTYPLVETFDLSGPSYCQADLVLPYVGGFPDYASVTGGSITITEFNLTTRRVKGTFTITYEKSGSSVVYEITSGTFNYGLDDDYFN